MKWVYRFLILILQVERELAVLNWLNSSGNLFLEAVLWQNRDVMGRQSRLLRHISRIFFFGHFLAIFLFGTWFFILPEFASAKMCDGGHGSSAVSAPATTWYLAEGYTGGDFDEWVLVQNPNPAPANVIVTFMLPDGSNSQAYYSLEPTSRFSIHADEIVPHSSVSTKIESDLPVIAERAMYFNYKGMSGGHSSVGASAASQTWYMAEGYTGGGFQTWILIQNPNSTSCQATVTFMTRDGSPVQRIYSLNPNSRLTISVDDIMPDDEVSTRVEANMPVVAERAMYFNSGGKDGGHDSVGVTAASNIWYLPEGFTGSDFDEWILIQNPGPDPANVDVTFMQQDC